jgi:primosomal protein N' (replication factor Y)
MAYDYRVPEGMPVMPGRFRRGAARQARNVTGVVWGAGTGDVAPEKLRDVIALLPALPMAERAAPLPRLGVGYTLSPLGNVLRMAMSVPEALVPARRPSLALSPGRARSDSTPAC